MIPPLEITGLTKVFDTPSGPFVAVKDVNAIINQSEFVWIIGHSGCGKSTVLAIAPGSTRRPKAAWIDRNRSPSRVRSGRGLSVAVPAAVDDGSTDVSWPSTARIRRARSRRGREVEPRARRDGRRRLD